MKKDLKSPLVSLKVAKASPELYLETIPVRVGPGRSGSGRVGPIVILRLTQSSWAGAGTELGNNTGPVKYHNIELNKHGLGRLSIEKN